MSKSLDVTLLVDSAAIPNDDMELSRTTDEPLTERHVAQTLRELGHSVRVMGVGDDLDAVLKEFREHRPELVFNLTEQFADNRQLDMNVAGLMEMMSIPFTGTGSMGLMLCRDKGLCKEILSFHRIKVPRFATFVPGKRFRVPKKLTFPLIVKPTLEDGSDGISMSSVVNNAEELEKRTQFVHERWRQAAIAEEFVEGQEIYVGLLGNGRVKALPPRGVNFGELGEHHPAVATSRVKHDAEYRQKWNIEYGPAQLDEKTFGKVAKISRKIYRLLRLRDFGRIDLRVTPTGEIVFLEANPNPDIAYGEDVAEAAEAAGIEYTELIGRIVRLALTRYKT